MRFLCHYNKYLTHMVQRFMYTQSISILFQTVFTNIKIS